tara:strand:- start:481 stop:1785 length:1305 start_codon:yes stop_codon:yes gene_type:complete
MIKKTIFGFLNRKNINIFILSIGMIFLIVINITYFYLHLTANINTNDYAFNELFINYQAGFIRRGLLGEIFWQANKIFLVSPIVFFSTFFLFIYIAQICLFYFLFKKFISSKIIFVFLLLSPSLLLFHIYSPDLYFIKDSIIKFTILLHAYIFYYFSILNKQNEKYYNYLKFLILPILTVVILTHEYQVFSLSVHFLISLGAVKKDSQFKQVFKIYSLLIIPFLLMILFIGNEVQFENLSQILKKFDIELNPHLGGGLYKYLGAFYKWHFFYFSYRDFVNLFISIILSVFVFIVLFEYMIEKKIIKTQSKHQSRYLLYFIPTLIPFLLTTDHGRNLSFIGFYLISFYSILDLNIKKLINLNEKIYKSLIIKYSLIIFLIFYVFMWKLNQFAGFGLRGNPNDIFQGSLFSEFIRFVKFIYIFIDLNIVNLPEIKL